MYLEIGAISEQFLSDSACLISALPYICAEATWNAIRHSGLILCVVPAAKATFDLHEPLLAFTEAY
jgi:hypothetical protein